MYKTWSGSLKTNIPIQRPKNNDEVSLILKRARINGHKVRVMGATHSEDNLTVTDIDNKTEIISLFDYRNKDWSLLLNTKDDTVRIEAGRSFLDLISFLRPRQYILRTNTAGPFFTIGGVISNSVHGASIDEGFIHENVHSMLVMFANGSIKEITDPVELSYFRCSFGLLGIILCITLKVKKINHLQMSVIHKTFKDGEWSRAIVTEFINDILSQYQTAEFFFNGFNKIVCLVSKNLSGYKTILSRPDIFNKYTKIYKKQLRHNKEIALTGAVNVLPLINNHRLVDNHKLIAAMLTKLSMNVVSHEWSKSNLRANDNYYLTNNIFVARFNSIARFIPIDYMFDAINISREHWSYKNNKHFTDDELEQYVGLNNNDSYNNSHDHFYFNYPIEFRFINVKNPAFLTNIEPGHYISIEFINNRTNDHEHIVHNHEYAKYFMSIERDLAKLPNGGVHFGKGHGYDYDPVRKYVRPFQTDFEPIFSKDQIFKFKKLMRSYDPYTLFSSGSMMKYFDINKNDR